MSSQSTLYPSSAVCDRTDSTYADAIGYKIFSAYDSCGDGIQFTKVETVVNTYVLSTLYLKVHAFIKNVDIVALIVAPTAL